ncbi:MAG: ZIP family metal transporter [Acidimicrobiia bacterium]
MSTAKVLLLGGIAGMTILLGLPIGRLRRAALRTRAFLNALAIGILVFLVFDVLSHANEPVEAALTAAHDGDGSWARFVGLSAVFALGIAVGLVGLVYYDKRMNAAITAETEAVKAGAWTPAHHLAFLIAAGIGLHNFSEGLAIGQSAANGDVNLAIVLIIGFALHNGTEGFGIVAPLAAEQQRPSWTFLATMGLVGGGPTFVGTLVGHSFVNDTLFLGFLALAAGSILYVIVQLVKVAARQKLPEVLMWGIFVGLVAGFATDYVLVVAGG